MKKMFNSKWITVVQVSEIHTSWGYTYGLYRYGNAYYIDECDADKYVIELGKFDNDTDAIKSFKEYMEDLEKEIQNED